MFFSKYYIGFGLILALCFLKTECEVGLVASSTVGDLGLIYICKFKKSGLDEDKAIQWSVNGVNANTYTDQFNFFNLYMRQGVYVEQTSTLKITNPVALRGPTEIKCSVNDVSRTFYMNNVVPGNPSNFRFPANTPDVKDKCDEWKGHLVGCNTTSANCECALKALEIIDITNEFPIKKNPFIAFKIVDKTLPHSSGNTKKYTAYVNPNSDENPREKWGIIKTTDTSLYLQSIGSSIKSDVLHDVAIRHYGAMWSRDCYFPGKDYFVEEHFNLKTSSLVPGQPKLTELGSEIDEWNESHPPTEWKYDYTPYPVIIQWEQPSNLLVADTRDTFIPVLYKNGKLDPNAKRTGDLEFQAPNWKSHDAFAVRYQSTEERYIGPLSKYFEWFTSWGGKGFMSIDEANCSFC